jgi:N-acetylmuramoyl-L-alanine amidase
VFKFAAIIFGGIFLFLAGCSTVPSDNEETVPQEWSATNTVSQPVPPAKKFSPRPAVKTIPAIPATPPRTNPPPQKMAPPAPILTWTSLDRWAAENKLAAPRKVANSPVASYAINSARGTLTLVIGSREAVWRGLEIHLGFAPEFIDDQVFVHGLDLQKNLEPLLLDPTLTFGTNRVIVLDPGHGGNKPGTMSVLDGRTENARLGAAAQAIARNQRLEGFPHAHERLGHRPVQPRELRRGAPGGHLHQPAFQLRRAKKRGERPGNLLPHADGDALDAHARLQRPGDGPLSEQLF